MACIGLRIETHVSVTRMLKPLETALRAALIGAPLGLTIGVAIAMLHLNVQTLMVSGVGITPSVAGLLLGSALGFLIGLTAGCIRRTT